MWAQNGTAAGEVVLLYMCWRIFAASLHGPVRSQGHGACASMAIFYQWLLTPQSKSASVRNLFEALSNLGREWAETVGARKD